MDSVPSSQQPGTQQPLQRDASARARREGDPGPEIVLARVNVASAANPVVGRVVSTARCTASERSAGLVRHIAFDVSGTPLAGAFVPGQSFGVIPPGNDSNGRPHALRLYSLASPVGGEDGRSCVVATTVKRTIDEHWQTHGLFTGVCSNYLCDLDVGAQVKLTGPSGKRFVLPLRPAEHDYVFFATGTGIAPFRGMVLDLLGLRADGSVDEARQRAMGPVRPRIALIAGAAYATDLLYHSLFDRLSREHDLFTYIPAVSRHDGPGDLRSGYVQDRVRTHRGVIGPMLRSPRTLVYMCGLLGMELGIFRALHAELMPHELTRWMDIDPEVAASPDGWTRKMVHRQLRPSRRMFIEVYE